VRSEGVDVNCLPSHSLQSQVIMGYAKTVSIGLDEHGTRPTYSNYGQTIEAGRDSESRCGGRVRQGCGKNAQSDGDRLAERCTLRVNG
jgi:hypothetical protein